MISRLPQRFGVALYHGGEPAHVQKEQMQKQERSFARQGELRMTTKTKGREAKKGNSRQSGDWRSQENQRQKTKPQKQMHAKPPTEKRPQNARPTVAATKAKANAKSNAPAQKAAATQATANSEVTAKAKTPLHDQNQKRRRGPGSGREIHAAFMKWEYDQFTEIALLPRTDGLCEFHRRGATWKTHL